MRPLLSILLLLQGVLCTAQPFTLQPHARMTVDEGARIFFSNEARFAGTLNSQGVLSLSKDADFGTNTVGGLLRFVGQNDQQLRATDLISARLELNKQGSLKLAASRLEITGSLHMKQGYLLTHDTPVLVSGEGIKGGSPESYIEGKVSQVAGGSSLYYPMGYNGYFNSFTLTETSKGDRVAVEVTQPEVDRLLPGDSLLGLSDEVEWVVTKESEGPLSSSVEINFAGLDLTQLPNFQQIRAHRYSPVIATKTAGETKYTQLGIRSLEDTDSLSYGILSASKPLSLTQEPLFVSIGMMPVSAGPQFYVPNVFSPNARIEKNRVFRPFLAGYTIDEIHMTIWDGYNKEMYNVRETSPDIEVYGWDGKLANGTFANEGIYYYVVTLSTPYGDFEQKGSFILIR